MVGPAATATIATTVWLNSPELVYAKEAQPDLTKIRESVLDLIEKDEEKRGDGSMFCSRDGANLCLDLDENNL